MSQMWRYESALIENCRALEIDNFYVLGIISYNVTMEALFDCLTVLSLGYTLFSYISFLL